MLHRETDVAQVIGFVHHRNHAEFAEAFEQRGIFEHRQDNDGNVREVAPQVADERQTVAVLAARHGKVRHQHVAGNRLQRLDKVSGLAGAANDLDPGKVEQCMFRTKQDHRMIVGDYDPDWLLHYPSIYANPLVSPARAPVDISRLVSGV